MRRKDKHSDNEDSQELGRGKSVLSFLTENGWNLGIRERKFSLLTMLLKYSDYAPCLQSNKNIFKQHPVRVSTKLLPWNTFVEHVRG